MPHSPEVSQFTLKTPFDMTVGCIYSVSLALRPLCAGKRPGIHCLHMRQIPHKLIVYHHLTTQSVQSSVSENINRICLHCFHCECARQCKLLYLCCGGTSEN